MTTQQTFRTHKGEIVTGEALTAAYKQVADNWRANAHAIRAEDAYASHVTTELKDQLLRVALDVADQVERGEVRNFTIWQCVNQVLTGECIALLK